MEFPEPLRYTGFLLRRAQQMHVAVWTLEVSSEISSVQYGVLSALARHPGMSQRALGDVLDLDRSTIAELVGRLTRQRLIARERDGADRRRNLLNLTAAGLRVLEGLQPRVEAVERALTRDLDPRQREALRDALGLMLAGWSTHAAAELGRVRG